MDSSSNTTLINFTAMLLPGVHGGGQAAGGLQQVPVVLFWLPADRQVRPGWNWWMMQSCCLFRVFHLIGKNYMIRHLPSQSIKSFSYLTQMGSIHTAYNKPPKQSVLSNQLQMFIWSKNLIQSYELSISVMGCIIPLGNAVCKRE